MRFIRFLVFAYFLFLAGFFCTVPLRDLWDWIHGQALSPRPFSVFPEDCILTILGVCFGIASANAWVRRASAGARGTGWIVAASALSLIITIGIPIALYFYGREVGFWRSYGFIVVPTPIGILGLFAFRSHSEDANRTT